MDNIAPKQQLGLISMEAYWGALNNWCNKMEPRQNQDMAGNLAAFTHAMAQLALIICCAGR